MRASVVLLSGTMQNRSPLATHRQRRAKSSGLTQMSLVEHALCPLDPSLSLKPNFIQETSYYYTDANRHRKQAHVRIFCPQGLSASDEFYLWGLLAIALSQQTAVAELSATPYFCLRQLGFGDAAHSSGGYGFSHFRRAIARLASVSYHNDHFYDPVRGEHRQVAFGFFSYSLPLQAESSRAWRFMWDPIFFEFCQAASGALAFDLPTYRELDIASRRLYLLLKKIFWRHEETPEFDLRHLAVDVLGFAPSQPTWKLKQKVTRAVEVLIGSEILRLPPEVPSVTQLFSKRAAGQYAVRFYRGAHFERSTSSFSSDAVTNSPFYDQLTAIGFDEPSIQRILRTYDAQTISVWTDITLAARERRGIEFFRTSPQAYFMDSVKHAAAGTRTPPDWWRQLRVEEERLRRAEGTSQDQVGSERKFEEYLAHEARDTFDNVIQKVFMGLRASGASEPDARDRAAYIARMNLRAHFLREHPEFRED